MGSSPTGPVREIPTNAYGCHRAAGASSIRPWLERTVCAAGRLATRPPRVTGISHGRDLAPTRLEIDLHRGLRGTTVRVVGDKTDWNAHRIATRPVVIRPVGNDVQRPRQG